MLSLITSSLVLNLIDEVNNNLIKKEDALDLAKKIVKRKIVIVIQLKNYWIIG